MKEALMKTVFSLLAVFATIGFAQAGGFGGPPPFTNGSPLVSGVDGAYQATARGKNLTGIFRFTYQSGRQTSAPQLPTGSTVSNLITDPYNDYVFFVEGLVYRGLVQANINTSQIAGVLDNGSANVPVFGGESGGLGILSFIAGFFEGKMDQQSPYAAFSGTGQVAITNGSVGPDDSYSLNSGGTVDFKFKGVRAALDSNTTSENTAGS
jgi:hypothetical protein